MVVLMTIGMLLLWVILKLLLAFKQLFQIGFFTWMNLLKIEPLTTETSAEVACAFNNGWLLHYPFPLHVGHDQGPKFIGQAFHGLLTHSGIKNTLLQYS